jgi:hydrogenase maturation protease
MRRMAVRSRCSGNIAEMTLSNPSGRDLPETEGPARPTILIVGLGNPILGDDGIGWRVAERMQKRLEIEAASLPDLEVDCLALGGLSLMERLVGYQSAVIIDAIYTHQSPPGTVSCFPLEALPDQAAGHTTSAHDTSLLTAIALGRSMGALLPDKITIVAVEAKQVYDFSEELTAELAAAIPLAEQTVLDLVHQGGFL